MDEYQKDSDHQKDKSHISGPPSGPDEPKAPFPMTSPFMDWLKLQSAPHLQSLDPTTSQNVLEAEGTPDDQLVTDKPNEREEHPCRQKIQNKTQVSPASDPPENSSRSFPSSDRSKEVQKREEDQKQRRISERVSDLSAQKLVPQDQAGERLETKPEPEKTERSANDLPSAAQHTPASPEPNLPSARQEESVITPQQTDEENPRNPEISGPEQNERVVSLQADDHSPDQAGFDSESQKEADQSWADPDQLAVCDSLDLSLEPKDPDHQDLSASQQPAARQEDQEDQKDIENSKQPESFAAIPAGQIPSYSDGLSAIQQAPKQNWKTKWSKNRSNVKIPAWAKWTLRTLGALLGITAIWMLQVLMPLMPTGEPIAGSGPSSYIVVMIAAGIGILLSLIKGKAPECKHLWLIGIGSAMFALMLCLANYPSWYTDFPLTKPGIFNPQIFWQWLFAGFMLGIYAFQALAFLFGWLSRHAKGHRSLNPWIVFLIAFAIMFGILYYIFHEALYPGLWLSDSISQIKQAYTNVYSNHHPFAHTQIIKGLMGLGWSISQTMDGALAAYSIGSIFIMALVVSYAMMSLYEISSTYWIPVFAMVMFAGSYYNWFYAVSLLKDTYFAMAFLGLGTAMLRILCSTGKNSWNYFWLAFFAVGVCLFRSNGLIAMLVLSLICLICLWKTRKVFALVLLVSSLVCAWITGPVYDTMGIESAMYAESFSIPEQQIARVVVMGRPLTSAQRHQINRLIYIENIKKDYLYWLSDPIKAPLSSARNEALLQRNKKTYQQLWLDLFKEYPLDYLFAWVDQTMGYWNGDYDYWRVLTTKEMNEMGMENIVQNEELHQNLYDYAWWMQKVFSFPVGIGFHTWMSLAIGIYLLCTGKKTWPFVLLTLLTMGTLVAATPVYSEFRYAYFMFLSMPLLFACAFLQINAAKKQKSSIKMPEAIQRVKYSASSLMEKAKNKAHQLTKSGSSAETPDLTSQKEITLEELQQTLAEQNENQKDTFQIAPFTCHESVDSKVMQEAVSPNPSPAESEEDRAKRIRFSAAEDRSKLDDPAAALPISSLEEEKADPAQKESDLTEELRYQEDHASDLPFEETAKTKSGSEGELQEPVLTKEDAAQS